MSQLVITATATDAEGRQVIASVAVPIRQRAGQTVGPARPATA